MFELKFALIFAIELLISLVGFLPYTPCRASFPIRMIASIGLYLAGAAMIWQMMSPLPEIFIPVYCVMVSILIVPCAMISFEMNVWGGLYAVTGAYLVQNLTYCLSICVHQITGNNISFIGIMWDTYGIYMVISFFVWFILVRPEQLRMVCGKQKRPLILLALATVIMCVLLQSAFRSVQMTEETAARGTLIVEGYGILGCILALGLIGGMFERLQMESKKSTLEAMLESEQERSRITNETIEAINLKCHDLKHQLAYLEQHIHDPESQAAIDGIRRDIASYSCIVKTGNQTLDYVFVEKLLLCEKHGIRFTYQVDGEQVSFIKDLDLITLCGNAIDNAIEYLQTCPLEKRTMSMVIREDKGCVFVHLDNYCTDTLAFEDGLPVTSKSDKRFHGYGSQSIRHIVNRYGGNLYISVENEQYNLDIVFQPDDPRTPAIFTTEK